MNFTVEQINYDDFYLYEKESKSRRSNAYHIFMRCSFRTWHFLPEEKKMSFMRPALREIVIDRLDKKKLIPPNFNRSTDDPFKLAPFTSFDLRADLRKVVNFHWRLITPEKKLAWERRKERLNARPTVGGFEGDLPAALYDGDQVTSEEDVLRCLLRRDFRGIIHQFEKCFRRDRNCLSMYNKEENLYMKIKVDHKFYFSQCVTSIVMDSLFGGSLTKFRLNEHVSRDSVGGDVKTFHVLTRDRMREVLTATDVDLSTFFSYKNEEIEHRLCSYAIIKEVIRDYNDDEVSIKCYGVSEEDDNRIEFVFNNFENTALVRVQFSRPKLEKLLK